MRIAVFGAGGRTGALVVARALAEGHRVVALVRRPDALAPAEGLTLVRGDARELGTARHVVEGVDATISAMAIVAGETPTTDLSDATRAVVEALEAAGAPRFVVTANTSVFTTAPVAPPFAVVADEHRRNVATLRDSRLDWTVLAPGVLDDEPGETFEAVVDATPPRREMGRAAFAAACVEAVARPDWVHHVVGVSR